MEQTDDLELRNEDVYPDEAALENALGESYDTYRKLLKLINTLELTCEWRYYRDGKAWLCKVQHKKRTIVWMSARTGYIQATVYFPLSKMEPVRELELNQEVKERIEATKNVGASKPCTLDIKNEAVLEDLEKLVRLKIITK